MGFIGAGLVAGAGTFGGYVARATAASTVQVWGLDPNWDGGDPGACGCGACASCRSHAANKWFASAAAADGGRAHSFCKCSVVPLVQVNERIYNALFTDAGARPSVDLRHQWVQAVLAQNAQADAPDSGDSDEVRAVVRPVTVLQGAGGRRVLYVDVRSSQVVTASIAITRDGRMLAHKTVTGVRGTRRIKIEIPLRTRPGPARLRLKLRTASGHTRVVTRAIQIPRVHQPSPPR
jgi:hypothetical protein